MLKEITLKVKDNNVLADGIFKLDLVSDEKLPYCAAGQFVHLKLNSDAMLLRRPFCIYDADEKNISLIIAIVGKGTKEIAGFIRGQEVSVIMPIGNGFLIAERHKKVALLGGGVGCAPLLLVGKNNKDIEVNAFLGFAARDKILMADDFKKYCNFVKVSTDDGSYGFKGFCTDSFMEEYRKGYRPDVIFTCGTEGMIKAVKKVCADLEIEGYMSGEIRMGCGVGACLVCACAVKGTDGEVHNKRACVDGPVFSLSEVVL